VAIFVAENVEPIRAPRIKGNLSHLKPATGSGNHELSQRINTNNPFGKEGFALTVQRSRNQLKLPFGHEHFRSLRSMHNLWLRLKRRQVQRGINRPFRQSVMRSLPKLVFLLVAGFAARRLAVTREDCRISFLREACRLSRLEHDRCRFRVPEFQHDNSSQDGRGNQHPEEERSTRSCLSRFANPRH
jgi:hypothetical protein